MTSPRRRRVLLAALACFAGLARPGAALSIHPRPAFDDAPLADPDGLRDPASAGGSRIALTSGLVDVSYLSRSLDGDGEVSLLEPVGRVTRDAERLRGETGRARAGRRRR